MGRTEHTRPSGWLFPARTTAYFLSVAALCLGILSLLGLQQIRSANEQNSSVRIDRAGRAAAALVEQRTDISGITRNAQGSPEQITINGSAGLRPGPSWEAILDSASVVNQGAANLFRFNTATTSFDRLATTFRGPDGSRIGGSQVEPGLIVSGHPSFESMMSGNRYVGEVPVAGRLRLAYLIPVLDVDQSVVGIIAVDVGWVDDLNRINQSAVRRTLTVTAVLLGLLAAVCVLVMFVSFRPLHRLTDFAHALGSATGDQSITLTDRRDEIGYLANGLAKVAELQSSLRHRAYTDDLTGLANRAALIEELERRIGHVDEAEDTHGFEVFIIDLDGFKEINDGLGHRAGDEVLRHFADSLRQIVQPGEFLARHGGDEFALLSVIHHHDPSKVDEIAQRVHGAAATAASTLGDTRLTASIGIAVIPAHGKNSAEAISHADLALYEVKNTERGASQIYNPALSGVFQRRLYLSHELRLALNDGALEVAYQPLYDTCGRLCALEALVRWTHPTEGPIPPDEFIPIAEGLGLIQQLGTFVLDEACRQVAAWSSSHAYVPVVCVNVSSIQIANPRFPDTVMASLQRHRLSPSQICLELTESVLVPSKNSPHRAVLASLSAMGVALAIDDFGTGYSSLNYLHELVVDQVKIDRTFVNAAVDDPRQAELLAGIIALGKNLGLSVVLEGIETQAELALALLNECDLLQGFLLARPQRPEAVAELFGVAQPLLHNPQDQTLLAKHSRGCDHMACNYQ